MAERPLGSFDSLKFCGFWGAMPPRPPPLPISYLLLPLISNFAFLTMHRLDVLYRPDNLIWFKEKYMFLDLGENKHGSILKENKK